MIRHLRSQISDLEANTAVLEKSHQQALKEKEKDALERIEARAEQVKEKEQLSFEERLNAEI